MRRLSRIAKWAGVGVAVIIVLLMVASFAVDEPLRAYLERQLNSKVDGYSFRLEKLDFHPFGFSVDLINLYVIQNSDPDPPVAKIEKWHAALQWHALLFGRLVNDQRFERPILYITLKKVEKESKDDKPIEERGWQDAVESVYPFKINEVVISDGEFTYVDDANPSRPIHVGHVNLTASNIRNVHSQDREYPSKFHLEGDLFDQGKLIVDGHADFLAEPFAGIKAAFQLGPTPLEHLLPVTGRYNLQLRQGTIAGEGEVEYAPTKKFVQMKSLDLQDVRLDYVHALETAGVEQKRARETYETGKELTNHEELVIHVDHARLTDSEFGYVNQATKPAYRVFMADTNLELENFSNQLREGESRITLKGRFMGNGDTNVTGVFRPDTGSPNFDLAVKIDEAQMKSMNDLWRAYGNFDVVNGLFSFYSELNVKNGGVEGYVKPMFKDVKAYDPGQDRRKNPLRKMYEGLVSDVAKLLENRQRSEVATKADMSGPLENPRMNTIDTVLRLVENAFFKSILPGLERETGRV
jgi:hypothetical protein